MARTSKDIQGDLMRLLAVSELAASINGAVYREGYRPRDSRMEDAVVVFTAGLAGQVQTGVVTVRVFIPDILLSGVMVENGQRTAQIETLLQSFADSLTTAGSDYRWQQRDIVRTDYDHEFRQHFCVLALFFSVL